MPNETIQGPLGCTKTELPELIDMVNAVFRPDGAQNIFTDYPLVYGDENLANIRLIRVGGAIAAEVPFLAWPVEHAGCRIKVGIISATATHADHRMRGHGLRCLNSCVQRMTELGVDLSVLWTRVPTFRFYHHAAYEAVGDQGATFDCTRADAARFGDGGHTIATYDPNTRQFLANIQSLHTSGPTGIVRTTEQAATLLALPRLKTLLALRENQPAAYLCVSASSNKAGIIEGAGDPPALETLMQHALTQLEDDEPVRVHTPSCPTVLEALMRRALPDRKPGSGDNMMVRINDVPGFLRKIAPWLARQHGDGSASVSIHITDADQTVALDFADGTMTVCAQRRPQHVQMSRRALTAAIFGPHEACPHEPPPAELARLFPFTFPIWVLDRS